MRNRRKLLALGILDTLYVDYKKGVPLTRMIRDAELDISGPHLTKLLAWYQLSLTDSMVELSLTPTWVDQRSTSIQEQPDDANYIGLFPIGEWEES